MNCERLKEGRTWAEIDLGALRHNAAVARKFAGDRRIMAVVKANAYGHGISDVVRNLEGLVDLFGVSSLMEAEEIRETGVKRPIYFLGSGLPDEIPGIVDLDDVVVTISAKEEARLLSRHAVSRGRCVPIHVAIDTGMGRFGFQPEEWTGTLIAELQALPGITLAGLMSHLPSADEDEAFTRRQFQVFSRLLEKVPGLDAHIANSAGLIGYPSERIGNLVRPGLMLYGCSPVDVPGLDLHPVMSLKSRIAVVRLLPAGSSISYGRSYVTERPMRVATVAVGYGDGYRRHVSGNGGEVAVRGQRCRILGRVTMDQIMIDVDHLSDVTAGDEVLLFGSSGPGDSVRISVEEVAHNAGSIPWEIFTGITPRVRRIPSAGTVVPETS